MTCPQPAWRCVALLVVVSFLLPPARAQQSAPAPAPSPAAMPAPTPAPAADNAPAATFDTLLAADSYAIYSEVRAIGQYLASKEINELLGSLRGAPDAPRELLTVLDFVTARTELLNNARLLIAYMPTRTQLPEGIAALELSSPEEAQKLETDVRRFIAATLAAQTSPPPAGAAPAAATAPGQRRPTSPNAPSPVQPRRRANRSADTVLRAEVRPAPTPPTVPRVPPFHMERIGALLVMSDKQFSAASLHPADLPLLSAEPNFQTARGRFAHETLFIYVNTKRTERNTELQRAAAQAAEEQRLAAERTQQPYLSNGNANTNANANSAANAADLARADANENMSLPPPPPATPPDEPEAGVVSGSPTSADEPPAAPTPTPTPLSPEAAAKAERERAAQEFADTLARALFGGGLFSGARWPEAVAVAANFEDDELVARALFFSDAEEQAPHPIPFLPFVLSGPAVTPAAASVLPADTAIAVSASLDLPQMYDRVASSLRLLDLAAPRADSAPFDTQLNAFEQVNGFRIKEDLLAALGNELGVGLPAEWLSGGRRPAPVGAADAPPPAPTGPVFVIALNDKRAFKALLPRALGALGLPGLSEQNLYEQRGQVELLSFTQGAAAFIDRFLVIAPDAATMRHVTDAYNNHTTLADRQEFRAPARWQPPQLLGQVYVSGAVVQQFFNDPKSALEDVDDLPTRALLLRLSDTPGAVTYALTKEGPGLLHELHVPTELLRLMYAGSLVDAHLAPTRRAEAQAIYTLSRIVSAEQAHKQRTGRYATLTTLKRTRPDDDSDALAGELAIEGYDLKVTLAGDNFAVTATPTNYRKPGRRSFYVDQTGLLRAADLNGRVAAADAPPAN